MRRCAAALALLAAVVAAPVPARHAPPAVTTTIATPAATTDTVPLLTDDQADPTAGDPEVKQLSVELARGQLRALIGRVRFAAALDDYQAEMYRHHQFWTDAAAIAVYAITFFGLICAGVQFRLFARLRGTEVHDDAASAGSVELPGGAKINSPFLGVIVLFLSLGFFYLYLTNVYPILSVAEIEAKRTAASSQPADK
ncbi:hypothetical protein [Polymorphobacter megasporae]|uniref:hypothetical protein n=1 Tax=Glacieibacterium megasporae TaxID=2835787 RepID=UPI001C1DE61E|nr:hypothetical protein [Polymorphobacter megasporae]UAJ09597.1 hypothetical protein KTC28_14965 [Polymorphobacter megasporae]